MVPTSQGRWVFEEFCSTSGRPSEPIISFYDQQASGCGSAEQAENLCIGHPLPVCVASHQRSQPRGFESQESMLRRANSWAYTATLRRCRMRYLCRMRKGRFRAQGALPSATAMCMHVASQGSKYSAFPAKSQVTVKVQDVSGTA